MSWGRGEVVSRGIEVTSLLKTEMFISQVAVLWIIDFYHHQYFSAQKLKLARASLGRGAPVEHVHLGCV